MDATREIEYKMEERLSKNTCCSNINTKKEIPSFLEVKDVLFNEARFTY